MPLRSRVLLAGAIIVPLAPATACSGSGTAGSPAAPGGGIPAGPAPGSQSLSEAGSTLLAPVMGAWTTAYHQRYPNAFTGLDVGIIVAAVIMAAGCAWGLARRIAEYR